MTVPWFSAFLAALGTGLFAFCLPVPVAEAGKGFHRMTAAFGLFFAATAALTRPFEASAAGIAGWAFLGAAAFAAGLTAASSDRAAAAAPFLAALAGLAALLAGVRFPSRGLPSEPWIAAASLAACAAMLGAALDTMMLGHWHLVKRGMSFGPLERMNRLFGAAIGVRAAVLAAEGLVLADVSRAAPQEQLVFAGRLVVGVLAPGALCWMTGRCIRIRSNQSATGILYVACVVVLAGEMAAAWSLGAL
ncbi:MAG: hypothetical protein IT452_13440 [Planctomycetia bacterium]|nr:hypothetical protein [Planctomycetia bacterium]